MSRPGKVLKALCKKLGVRLTVKRGQKRVYKSVAVLKRQCANKKKKVKRKRKFGKNTTFKTLKKYAIPASIGAGLGVAGTALGMKAYLNNLYLKILNNEIQPENVPSLILKILDKRFKYQNYIKDVAIQIESDYEDILKKSRPIGGEITFSIDFNRHGSRYAKALENLEKSKKRDSMSDYYEDALLLPHRIQFVTHMKKYKTIMFKKNKYMSIKTAKELYPGNFLSRDSYENQKRIQDENEKLKESIADKQLKDSIELYNMMKMEDEAVDNVLNKKVLTPVNEVMLFGKKKRRKRKKKK